MATAYTFRTTEPQFYAAALLEAFPLQCGTDRGTAEHQKWLPQDRRNLLNTSMKT